MNLSTDSQNKLKIYEENFEKAYIDSAIEFYQSRASAYLEENGIVNYMRYVSRSVLCYAILNLCCTIFHSDDEIICPV